MLKADPSSATPSWWGIPQNVSLQQNATVKWIKLIHWHPPVHIEPSAYKRRKRWSDTCALLHRQIWGSSSQTNSRSRITSVRWCELLADKSWTTPAHFLLEKVEWNVTPVNWSLTKVEWNVTPAHCSLTKVELKCHSCELLADDFASCWKLKIIRKLM